METYTHWIPTSSPATSIPINDANSVFYPYSEDHAIQQSASSWVYYASTDPAEFQTLPSSDLINGLKLDPSMMFPDASPAFPARNDDELFNSVTKTLLQQNSNDFAIASENLTTNEDQNTFHKSSAMLSSPAFVNDGSRSKYTTTLLKSDKHMKWYPPLLPSVLNHQGVIVRRASHNSRDGSERITVHMRSLDDGYKYPSHLSILTHYSQ